MLARHIVPGLLACLMLGGCQLPQIKSPEGIADKAIRTLNKRVAKVVDDKDRADAIIADFKRIQELFMEFSGVQAEHREKMGHLLRDFDSTAPEIMEHISGYNAYKARQIERVHDTLRSIDSNMTETEEQALRKHIQIVMESLFGLTSPP